MAVQKPQSATSTEEGQGIHLLVLVHGLWGDPVHLKRVVEGIQKAYPPSSTPLRVLVPKTNAGSLTYDGIDVGGERVVSEIHEYIRALAQPSSDNASTDSSTSSASSPSTKASPQQPTQSSAQSSTPQRVTKISFLGYSLGGLVSRYAIGLLASTSFFDTVEPVNFTTFATPHLGVRTPSTGFVYSAFNTLGSFTLCTSGRQLFTIDTFRDTGRCLLDLLADPSSIFMRGLSLFPRRSVYANIINDRAVPYYTAAMSSTDPFVDLDAVTLNAAPGYDDVILDSQQPATPRQSPATFYESVSNAAGRAWSRAPFVAAMGVAAPIAVTAYLVNAGWQTYNSAARLKLHREGKLGVTDAEQWRQVPLIVEKLNQGAEQAMEMAQAAGAEEFLLDDDDDDDDNNDAEHDGERKRDEKQERRRRRRRDEKLGKPDDDAAAAAAVAEALELARKKDERDGEAEAVTVTAEAKADTLPRNDGPFPTLALTPAQFRMIRHLDALGFDKYPVHVRRATHSHAAIVVRMERASFEDGRVAIRHWTERFAV